MVSLSLFLFLNNSLVSFSACKSISHESIVLNQSDLSPLDILILDLKDVKRLIENGDNKTAITILKSALGNVRRVKEFDKNTKKTTEKRIRKGIQLLKQNKNQEALDLIQTGFDALVEGGLVPPGTFD